MANYKMSDELIQFCTKCKLNLNHRVILVDKGDPKRVLCLTCKTERRYSDPTAKSKTGTKRVFGARVPKINPETVWQEKLSASTKSVKPYTIDARFGLENRVRHPSFGIGLVVENIHPDKVKIYFPEGVKILRCGVK